MKKSSQSLQAPCEIEAPQYLTRHFTVPKTCHGYVFALVTMKDPQFKTFSIGETKNSLSDELRKLNSKDVSGIRKLSKSTLGSWIFLLEFLH